MKGSGRMSTKNVSFRINDELKTEADEVLRDIGLNMTSALTLFLQQVVNKRSIPFTLEASDSFYSHENKKILDARIEEYKEGKFTEHELIEVD